MSTTRTPQATSTKEFAILQAFKKLQNDVVRISDGLAENKDKELKNMLQQFEVQLQRLYADSVIVENKSFKNIPLTHIDHLDEVVILIDANYVIHFTSDSANELLGFETNELIGQSVDELFSYFDKQLLQKQLAKIVSGSIGGSYDNTTHRYRLSTKNGEIKWFELRLIRQENLLDQKPFGLLIGRNIDQVVRLEETLKQAKKEAEDQSKYKSLFLANMSHEIRTPLNGIVGFAHLMGRNDLPVEKRKRFINFIDSCSHQLLTLVNDIIDISKVEAGKLKFHYEYFSLHAMLDSLLTQFQTQIALNESKVELRFVKPTGDIRLYGDEVRIRQVFTNLIGNALKFTHEGYVEFGYCGLDAKTIEFFVRDTGDGIPAAYQSIIFNPYQQAGNYRNGTGLGLAISKSLVENMNGKIEMSTTEGEGTEFIFVLPQKYISE